MRQNDTGDMISHQMSNIDQSSDVISDIQTPISDIRVSISDVWLPISDVRYLYPKYEVQHVTRIRCKGLGLGQWLTRAKAKARAMARVRDRAGTRISNIKNIYWMSEIIQVIKIDI